ncbi:MAG: phosphoribosylglycinamide formyltransferase-1 [Methylophagaceae bacterium]|jgi:phosphoribosylglycinamide formyltransferase-1
MIMNITSTITDKTPRVVILISGRGSNMISIVNAVTDGSLPIKIAAVISNRPDAAGIEFAQQAGIDTAIIDHKAFASREDFDQAMANKIDTYSPDLVVLAGFMRILTPEFVEHYANKLINIHPALLPKFKGMDTHQRAIDAGETEHGASVHFVTAELDAGPVILQAKVPILSTDTAETLAARVLKQEHKLYPEAIIKLVTTP